MENPLTNRRTLLIWDSESTPPDGDWITILWRSFAEDDNPDVISIPKLVEEQADTLRLRYLAWIYELGETRLKGKRLVDHLELRPGFSYWWMTLLAQKFNASGASQIDNAIKAFALEDLISVHSAVSVVLVSSNDKLASTLQCFCEKLRLRFKWNSVDPAEKPKLTATLIYSCLPGPIRAFIYCLWSLFRSLHLACTKKAAARSLNGEIVFADVLVHLDKKAFKTGKFISNYWTVLVDTLFRSGVKMNWLHNYFYQESIPSLVRAQKLIDNFNKCSSGIQEHALIEANLSWSVLVRAMKDYFSICWVSLHLSKVSRNFAPAGSFLNFWPLFKDEWNESLRGQMAMVCSLHISLYENFFSDMPYKKLGFYIQENQPWEMALIYAWRVAGHGKLIGVPHTTVRFWDLRYFYDLRSYAGTGNNVLPKPDLVAVNGPVAKKAYLDGGYSDSQVTEVEALRFLHLLNRVSASATIQASKKPMKILICGDFLSATNHKILSWLAIAARSLPPGTSYVFKPHPAYPVDLTHYPSLILEMTDAPLSELLTAVDVVFTSNITSTAVDAYCSYVPVIQILDGDTLNMSPLRGLKNVVYVTSPMELAKALRNAPNRELVPAEPYFCLDKRLPRWRELLGLSSADV